MLQGKESIQSIHPVAQGRVDCWWLHDYWPKRLSGQTAKTVKSDFKLHEVIQLEETPTMSGCDPKAAWSFFSHPPALSTAAVTEGGRFISASGLLQEEH